MIGKKLNFGLKRKGAIVTLESVVAGMLFISFIALIIPSFSGNYESDVPVARRAQRILFSLEKAQGLRSATLERNLTEIKEMVVNHTSQEYTVGVGLFYMNSTGGSFSTPTSKEVEFIVNKSRSHKDILKLWITGQDPELSLNGELIWSLSGRVNNYYKKLDVSSITQNGFNSFILSFSDSSTVEWNLDRYYYIQKGTLPQEKEIYTYGINLAGNKTLFNPSRVKVFLWR